METVDINVKTVTRLGSVSEENIQAIKNLGKFYEKITLKQLQTKFDKWNKEKDTFGEGQAEFLDEAYDIGGSDCKICESVGSECGDCFWEIYYQEMKAQLNKTSDDLGLQQDAGLCNCANHDTLYKLISDDYDENTGAYKTFTKRNLPALLKLMHNRGKYIKDLMKELNL